MLGVGGGGPAQSNSQTCAQQQWSVCLEPCRALPCWPIAYKEGKHCGKRCHAVPVQHLVILVINYNPGQHKHLQNPLLQRSLIKKQLMCQHTFNLLHLGRPSNPHGSRQQPKQSVLQGCQMLHVCQCTCDCFAAASCHRCCCAGMDLSNSLVMQPRKIKDKSV
jgi:hypothetical protein